MRQVGEYEIQGLMAAGLKVSRTNMGALRLSKGLYWIYWN